MQRRLFIALLLALAGLLCVTSAVLAVFTDPIVIQFGATTPANMYRVFYSVVEPNDWLIIAESYLVTADSTPSTAAYSFSLMNTAGTSIIKSTPLWSYGDRPISLYLSASNVTALGLTVNGAYILKLGVNPTIATASVNNTISKVLSSDNYIDESLATTSLDPLARFCIDIGHDMESVDGVSTYLVASGGTYYVTSVGASLFLQGVTNLDVVCPNLFQTSISPMTVAVATANMSYPNSMNSTNILGSSANRGIVNLAAWFGMSDTPGAKAVILVGLAAVILLALGKRVQDKTMLMMLAVLFFVFAVWIGIASWMVMIVIAVTVAILMFYYLWSRGIL